MRILASYGCKVNGDSFFVSFETMGDVPKDQSDATADELFAKARAAVQRQQVKPEVPSESVQPKKDNGNGNGGNGKGSPDFVPVTKKQIYKINTLLEGINPEIQDHIFKQSLGHEIGSYKEISKKDGIRLIDFLISNVLTLEDMQGV